MRNKLYITILMAAIMLGAGFGDVRAGVESEINRGDKSDRGGEVNKRDSKLGKLIAHIQARMSKQSNSCSKGTMPKVVFRVGSKPTVTCAKPETIGGKQCKYGSVRVARTMSTKDSKMGKALTKSPKAHLNCSYCASDFTINKVTYVNNKLKSPKVRTVSKPGVQCAVTMEKLVAQRCKGKNCKPDDVTTPGNSSSTPPAPTRKPSRQPAPSAMPPGGGMGGYPPPASVTPRSDRGLSKGAGSLIGSLGKMLGGFMNKRSSGRQHRPQPPKPECFVFTATDSTIKQGEFTELRWALSKTQMAHISPSVGMIHPLGGVVRVSPRKTTTYTLQMQNAYSYGQCPPVTITVAPPDVESYDVPQSERVVQMRCSPNTARRGDVATVLWSCPEDTTKSVGRSTEYASFNTGGAPSGSQRVTVTETGKFSVRCYDDGNHQIAIGSCKIFEGVRSGVSETVSSGSAGGGIVGDTPAGNAQLSITADKLRVNSGDTVTISWRAQGVSACRVTGPDGFTQDGARGSVTGKMLQTSTFELTCSTPQGQLSKSVTITAQ